MKEPAPHQSISASYWNAFLFLNNIILPFICLKVHQFLSKFLNSFENTNSGNKCLWHRVSLLPGGSITHKVWAVTLCTHK